MLHFVWEVFGRTQTKFFIAASRPFVVSRLLYTSHVKKYLLLLFHLKKWLTIYNLIIVSCYLHFLQVENPLIYFQLIFIVRVSTNQIGNKVGTQLRRRKRCSPIPKASKTNKHGNNKAKQLRTTVNKSSISISLQFLIRQAGTFMLMNLGVDESRFLV